jgi:trimeric autotransporter adhesin
VIDYTGNMGIGFTNPGGYKLAVNGPALSTAWNTFSDARFKKNIQTLESSLNKIMALNGVSYDWKKESFPDRNFAEGKQLGFIAQEVLNVIPELVTKDSEGYYSVNYVEAIPVLVEAMKEQQKMIDSLKAQDVHSKKKIAALEASLQNVQSNNTDVEKLKSEMETIKKALGLSVEASVPAKKEEKKNEK